MNNISNYLEEKWLGMLKGVAFNAPAKCYLAICTSASTDTIPGTEVADPEYARQEINFSAIQQENDYAQISNSTEIVFPFATQDWGTVTHFVIYDALTGGNMLYHGALKSPKVVDTDDQLRVPVGSLTVSLG